MDNLDQSSAQTPTAATTATPASLSQVQFDIDLSIYSQEALNYTCYDYAGRFYIEQTAKQPRTQSRTQTSTQSEQSEQSAHCQRI